MTTFRTHYDNLQVNPTASDEVIRSAYRALSQKYHPDRNQDNVDRSTRVMAIINKAYHVLSDPKLRAEHDAWIKAQNTSEFDARHKAQEPASPDPMRSSRAGKSPSTSGNFDQTWKDMGARRKGPQPDRHRPNASASHVPSPVPEANVKPEKEKLTLVGALFACVPAGWFLTVISQPFRRSDLASKEWTQLFFEPYFLGLLVTPVFGLMTISIVAWIVSRAFKQAHKNSPEIALATMSAAAILMATAPYLPRSAPDQKPLPISSSSPVPNRLAQAEAHRRYNETVSELEAQHPELNPDSPYFDRQAVGVVLQSKKSFEAEGMASDLAARRAVSLYFGASRIGH